MTASNPDNSRAANSTYHHVPARREHSARARARAHMSPHMYPPHDFDPDSSPSHFLPSVPFHVLSCRPHSLAYCAFYHLRSFSASTLCFIGTQASRVVTPVSRAPRSSSSPRGRRRRRRRRGCVDRPVGRQARARSLSLLRLCRPNAAPSVPPTYPPPPPTPEDSHGVSRLSRRR